MVGIGVITLIGSAFGYAGAQYSPLFLTIYLVIGAITNLCQFVVVIAIFGAQEQVLDHIQALDDQQHRLFNRQALLPPGPQSGSLTLGDHLAAKQVYHVELMQACTDHKDAVSRQDKP